MQNRDLIRVKKGLYVFGEQLARRPFYQEYLANVVSGPSAISLEYAQSYYGIIPEKITTITNITSQRSKTFLTPLGAFSYRHLPMEK